MAMLPLRRRRSAVQLILGCMALIILMIQIHTSERQGYTSHNETTASDTCPTATRFLDRPMRLTVLASYPGSGNTWLRYLIERMTGYATGSNWSDKQLLEKGFIGEFVRNKTTIVVKTHNDYSPTAKASVESTNRVILLLRNPYDTLLAEFNRYYTGGDHVAYAYVSAFIQHWNKFFEDSLKKWQPYYSNWLRCPDVEVVLFDDLKGDLKTQLSRIRDFLDDGSLKVNVDCALKNNEGNFRRDRSFQPHTNFFYDYTEVGSVNKAIDTLQTDLIHRFPHQNINISSWKIKFGFYKGSKNASSGE
ncbi:WSCD family member GA21586-like [Haliotis rufescens]|uniref:WSCD family member GA21586-like n=1 Tax=Haliotis rufescens TaxID=6454 RepID=UPI00201F1915|nr:WSCD family member GA21586-like [Haliotis rufescens]